MTAAALITLDAVCALYQGVSKRTLRALIARGSLPASKIGRAYFVAPADVAQLFAPTVRAPAGARHAESPSAREDRQLRDAGFAPAPRH
jgi:excisionase family DNA binding protein